jgi:predicted nucleic acid-binding protein
MHLIDTGVVIELRRAGTGRADPGLVTWASDVARQTLFVSALTLMELDAAASRAERRDKAVGAALAAWIDEKVMPAFEGRILAVDAAVARHRRQLSIADTRDALIAATAAAHGLTLVTRDIAAYRGAKIKLFNPWGYAPEPGANEDWRQAGRTAPPWLRNLFVRT